MRLREMASAIIQNLPAYSLANHPGRALDLPLGLSAQLSRPPGSAVRPAGIRWSEACGSEMIAATLLGFGP